MAPHDKGKSPLLSVRDLSVHFRGADDTASLAVERVAFDIFPGETVALVGERVWQNRIGTIYFEAAPYPAAFHGADSQVWFDNRNLLTLPENQLRQIRGADIAMIFQSP